MPVIGKYQDCFRGTGTPDLSYAKAPTTIAPKNGGEERRFPKWERRSPGRGDGDIGDSDRRLRRGGA